MKRPTAAQLKVLEAMRDGQRLERDMGLWRLIAPNGFAHRVPGQPCHVARQMQWISLVGGSSLDKPDQWSLTDLGRAALRKE
jgi:hypothetical protein